MCHACTSLISEVHASNRENGYMQIFTQCCHYYGGVKIQKNFFSLKHFSVYKIPINSGLLLSL